MNLQFRFPDYAWLVETMEFAQFLDLAFANDSGEIWLFNNDLEMIRQYESFSLLYLQRVAGTLRRNITAVRILVQPDRVDSKLGLEASLKKDAIFCKHLAEIARLRGGKDRLSTFYFGVANRTKMPPQLGANGAPNDTWIFYAQRADLDSGIVMLRHQYFPFQVAGENRRVAIVWMLQHYPELKVHLKKAFVKYFKCDAQFRRMEVTSTNPFDFKLVSASTRKKKRLPVSSPSVSLGDQVDVAIVAALPEEMAELKAALAPEKPRAIPLHEEYEYVVLTTKTGSKRVLLTTIIDQGAIPAAIRTWDMIQRWRPRHIILVGVAGGDPKDESQALGDIVIGNWIVGYERGKIVNGNFQKDSSKYTADDVLLKAATDLKNSSSWPRAMRIPRPSGSKKRPCHVHDDLAIGSGSKLVADAAFFEELQSIDRKIKAVEMEADGVGCACDKTRITKVKVLVIKGIMDKSNQETRNMSPALKKKWMRFAARAAAEFAVDVVRAVRMER